MYICMCVAFRFSPIQYYSVALKWHPDETQSHQQQLHSGRKPLLLSLNYVKFSFYSVFHSMRFRNTVNSKHFLMPYWIVFIYFFSIWCHEFVNNTQISNHMKLPNTYRLIFHMHAYRLVVHKLNFSSYQKSFLSNDTACTNHFHWCLTMIISHENMAHIFFSLDSFHFMLLRCTTPKHTSNKGKFSIGNLLVCQSTSRAFLTWTTFHWLHLCTENGKKS